MTGEGQEFMCLEASSPSPHPVGCGMMGISQGDGRALFTTVIQSTWTIYKSDDREGLDFRVAGLLSWKSPPKPTPIAFSSPSFPSTQSQSFLPALGTSLVGGRGGRCHISKERCEQEIRHYHRGERKRKQEEGQSWCGHSRPSHRWDHPCTSLKHILMEPGNTPVACGLLA